MTSTADWPICDLNNRRGRYPDWGRCPRCGLEAPSWSAPLCFAPVEAEVRPEGDGRGR
jgi:predicted amidophosphoribosyltransferase